MNRHRIAAGVCLVLLTGVATARVPDDFAYVRDATAQLQDGSIAVDTRPLEACKQRSLAGAVCLPAAAFLGPHRRLPSERDLLWLLGTAGLKGDETILVMGEDATARDFVAGLLYVSGQRRLRVLTQPIGRLLERGTNTGLGRERSFVRETVFEAPMRDGVVVLRDELRAMNPSPMLLDGRAETEYWGETVRSTRSGHLPGAVSLPGVALRATLATPTTRPVLPERELVAYAHDAYEGLAYLTLLTAGYGVPARLYLAGWSEWASYGALPIDAGAYPERASARPAEVLPVVQQNGALWAGIPALGVAAFAAGWWLKQRKAS